MGMREKLIELLSQVQDNGAIVIPTGQSDRCELVRNQEIADQLIADGVTIPVYCKECKHWHEETGWCTKHSHFIGCDGMACHPSQSSEWKMFDQDDFCSYGERRTDGK